MIWDYSCLGEALGYEFFREAGVPAPRTAYAWLSASVTTQWEQKPLGLYLMVEAVDNEFAAERFGSKATPVFKPVTLIDVQYGLSARPIRERQHDIIRCRTVAEIQEADPSG